MDKIYQLLKCLKNKNQCSQRDLAKETGFSLGMVNSLLKNMEDQKLISIHAHKGRFTYQLTESGLECLENILRERHQERLSLTMKTQDLKTAVILAAGQNRDFDMPVGFLPLEDNTLIERTIHMLLEFQINKIILVTGYKKAMYEEAFKNYPEIIFVENPRYKWTGTMASLACAAPYVDSDFLLIESDYVFEKVVLSELLNHESPNCLFVNAPRGSGDEAFVELDENHDLFRISKDIHELNHIDAELCGVNRISYSIYKKMLKQFDGNKNPYLNYEYVLENIGRLYKITTCSIDDCICMDIDNQVQYNQMINLYYPKLKKKETERDLEERRQQFAQIMGIPSDGVLSIEAAGGMTNRNYKVKTKESRYILRIPGRCTETMISRTNEKVNGKFGYLLGLNVDTVYFDEQSGVKISIYIPNAQTMTGPKVRLEKNMKLVAELLSRLHNSECELRGRFNVFEEIKVYEQLMEAAHVIPYEGYAQARHSFDHLAEVMNKLGWNLRPCHCDLVAENLIKDEHGRMYLIDWEYASVNDPMWDLASHFLECEFTPSEEELFIDYYTNGQGLSAVDLQKIDLFKITQDLLWAAWTMAKEANGEDFGTYGIDRLHRGIELMKRFETTYER